MKGLLETLVDRSLEILKEHGLMDFMEEEQFKRDTEWVKNLIRSEYDPVPSDWPHRSRGWDDGVDNITLQILLRFYKRAEKSSET